MDLRPCPRENGLLSRKAKVVREPTSLWDMVIPCQATIVEGVTTIEKIPYKEIYKKELSRVGKSPRARA